MSARAIWTGSLSFGLATMPVKVYKATDEPGDATKMNMLHKDCSTPINRVDQCSKCNKPVPASDIVKGVRNADGTYTIIDKAELDAIKPESSDVVAIEGFVANAIDSIYVRDTYYVMPDGKAAQDTYALLSTLCADGYAGQGRWTIHGREHNVLVRPFNGTLMIQTMRTVNEVRDAAECPNYQAPASVKVSDQLLAIGRQLRDSMLTTFDQTEYEDTYAAEFAKLVQNKKTGVVDATPRLAATPAAKSDLLAALTASLATKPEKAKKVAKPTTGSGPKRSKKSAEASA